MFEPITESELTAICGGKNDEPLPAAQPGQAVSASLSLGSYATPLGRATTSTRPPPNTTP